MPTSTPSAAQGSSQALQLTLNSTGPEWETRLQMVKLHIQYKPIKYSPLIGNHKKRSSTKLPPNIKIFSLLAAKVTCVWQTYKQHIFVILTPNTYT